MYYNRNRIETDFHIKGTPKYYFWKNNLLQMRLAFWHKGVAFDMQIQKTVWRCNSKYKRKDKCSTGHIIDDDIKTAFINQLNKIIDNDIVDKTKELLDSAVFNTTALEEKCDRLKAEAETIINEINREIKINSTIAQDQAEYTARYNSLCDKYRSLQERIEESQNSIANLKARKNRASEFFNNISVLNKPITEFNEYL